MKKKPKEPHPKLLRLASQLGVCDKDVARAMRTSAAKVREMMRNPSLSKEQYQALYRGICNAGRKAQANADIALAHLALNDGIKLSENQRYQENINKHLTISLPMQTNGRKYTGQNHDYYNGRRDEWN